ncbi:MAG: sodium:proton antiporter NhaD [Elusimicrobia bacterium]|nr:sodium:proton antiporter NhaD [Elusimicrobiota bacterium]
MPFLMLCIFAVGYIAIALEQKIRINKAATAILLAFISWGLVFFHYWHHDIQVSLQLNNHLADISQILFFLIGAMTIVEVIDSYHGFRILKQFIKAKKMRNLLWEVSFLTFFLSSFLDNVTTSIIMIALIHQLLPKNEDRLYFGSMVIIAANAGGAWTPIGDVTTTMLWIKGYVSSGKIIKQLITPSIVSMTVPLIFISMKIGNKPLSEVYPENPYFIKGTNTVLPVGVCALISVPVLKAVFDIPPYLGVLMGLSVLWIYTDLTHNKEKQLKVPRILKKVDFTSILFFMGILLAVSALETIGILSGISRQLFDLIKNNDIVAAVLGIISSIVDNVPLTAAAMGMYDIHIYPRDSHIWELIAYSVGTGGSLLIIGSAAGVVIMGMEKMDFGWYLKKISLIAFIGYLAGISALLLLNTIIF